uniref:HMG box domain-containing protein n=1 Tax=Mycena chlorophos TaxID=658473 RepID=A0ABQ0L8H6_MYCCL|nr:predicted protein [Mycena chlorophos]
MDDKGAHSALRRSTRRCINNQAREFVQIDAKESTGLSPRRKLNTFFWFRKLYGKHLDDTHPRESEKCRALADLWKSMSSLERQPYVLMSRRRRWGGPIKGGSSPALGVVGRSATVSGGTGGIPSAVSSSIDLSQDPALSAVANEVALEGNVSPSEHPSGTPKFPFDSTRRICSPRSGKVAPRESAEPGASAEPLLVLFRPHHLLVGFMEEPGAPCSATREAEDKGIARNRLLTGHPIFEPTPMRPAHSSALLALRDGNSTIFWSPTVPCDQLDETDWDLDLWQASRSLDSNTQDDVQLTADDSSAPFSLFSRDRTPADPLDIFKQEPFPFSRKVVDIEGIFCEAASVPACANLN